MKAFRQLGWRHDTSTPHCPQTNGLIERIVKIVILGTLVVLRMSGLGYEWWKEAMQAFCCGHNFAHGSTGVAALSNEHTEKTAHEIRFGETFPGHCIPFAARIF
eukprot:9432840-Pyramimonas_sp.AAC.1